MAARRGGRPVTSVRVSRKYVRRGFKLGAVVGAIFFLAQVFLRKQAPRKGDNATRTPAAPPVSQPQLRNATPEAAKTAADDGAVGGAPWVDPLEDGSCPVTHPVKAKQSSKIFHVPGGLAYDRTAPDRCYRDADAAEADGFRAAKR